MPDAHPLDVIQIESPCTQDFAAMAGDARKRFCETCGRRVHNLSQLTRAQANDLVCRAAGSLCVRFQRDLATGQVVTLDYAQPRRRRWPLVAALVVATGSAGGVLHVVFRKASIVPPPPSPMLGAMVMGGMPPPPQPPAAQRVATPNTSASDTSATP